MLQVQYKFRLDNLATVGVLISPLWLLRHVCASNSGTGGSASADFNSQSNDATNTADVSIHNHGSGGKISHSGNVDQSITQSNDIQASNTGDSGSASADFNSQTNTATNSADVDIHNHGGKISHSSNVDQSITQTNSISASNSPPTGLEANNITPVVSTSSADASFNTQSNDATNSADIDLSNH